VEPFDAAEPEDMTSASPPKKGEIEPIQRVSVINAPHGSKPSYMSLQLSGRTDSVSLIERSWANDGLGTNGWSQSSKGGWATTSTKKSVVSPGMWLAQNDLPERVL